MVDSLKWVHDERPGVRVRLRSITIQAMADN